MNIFSLIEELSLNKRARVGVGFHQADIMVESALASRDFADVLLVGDASQVENDNVEVIDSRKPEKTLVEALANGEIDAAVRGDLPATEILHHLREQFQIEQIQRAVLMRTHDDMFFFLAPVGIDEGQSKEERLEMGMKTAELLRRLDVEPVVGVLSGGRHGDRGRSPQIDQSLDDAEWITEQLSQHDIKAVHHQILIENAFRQSNIIIAPDGITGNLIFRSLKFLGGLGSMGAPILSDKMIFIDTTRSRKRYVNPIKLASALSAVKT